MSRADIEFELMETKEETYTRVKIGKDLEKYKEFFETIASAKPDVVELIKSSRDYDYFKIKGDFLNGR